MKLSNNKSTQFMAINADRYWQQIADLKKDVLEHVQDVMESVKEVDFTTDENEEFRYSYCTPTVCAWDKHLEADIFYDVDSIKGDIISYSNNDGYGGEKSLDDCTLNDLVGIYEYLGQYLAYNESSEDE